MGKHDHPHVEASGASLAKAAQSALEGAGERVRCASIQCWSPPSIF